MIEIVELLVADPPAVWADAGFAVEGGVCAVGHVRIVFAGEGGGIVGWRVRNVAAVAAIDGLPTEVVAAPLTEPGHHPNGAELIDHVVIMTPDCDRTVAAFRALGDEPRRERIGGSERHPVRQVFVRAGEVVLEIVGPVTTSLRDAAITEVSGPASFWGLAFTVADLDATAAHLGDRLGRVKDAVQAGRRIATLRTGPGGISVPTVCMSR